MKKKIVKKSLVIGLIILFIGAGVASGVNCGVEKVEKIKKIGNINRDVLTFNTTDDTTISHGSPDNNYGSSVSLTIRNDFGAGSSDWAYDVLIKFDISPIAPGTTINSATVYLYYYEWDDTYPGSRPLNLYRATSDWDEDIVTWNTQPTYASEPTDNSPVPFLVGNWMDWDVTTDVQDFVDGSQENYGWKVTDETSWGEVNIPITKFRSKEYGDFIPYLEIETGGGGQGDINFIDPELGYIYILGSKTYSPILDHEPLQWCIFIDYVLKCNVGYSGIIDYVEFHVSSLQDSDTVIDPLPPFECTFKSNLKSAFAYTITATAYHNGQICGIDEVGPVAFFHLPEPTS